MHFHASTVLNCSFTPPAGVSIPTNKTKRPVFLDWSILFSVLTSGHPSGVLEDRFRRIRPANPSIERVGGTRAPRIDLLGGRGIQFPQTRHEFTSFVRCETCHDYSDFGRKFWQFFQDSCGYLSGFECCFDSYQSGSCHPIHDLRFRLCWARSALKAWSFGQGLKTSSFGFSTTGCLGCSGCFGASASSSEILFCKSWISRRKRSFSRFKNISLIPQLLLRASWLASFDTISSYFSDVPGVLPGLWLCVPVVSYLGIPDIGLGSSGKSQRWV